MNAAQAKTELGNARGHIQFEAGRGQLRAPGDRARYAAIALAQARAAVYATCAAFASDDGTGVPPALMAKILKAGLAISSSKQSGDNNADAAATAIAAIDASSAFDAQVVAIGKVAGAHVGTLGVKTAAVAKQLIADMITQAQAAQAQSKG